MSMRGLAAVGVLALLAACANVTPAGRNAGRAPAPPTIEAPAPAPAQLPPPRVIPTAPPAAAPNVSVTPAPAPRPPNPDGDIVVPGQVQRQLPPPEGDPRSVAERRQDIRAWDRCVSRAQAIFETDPMRPQLESPEDQCAQALGMFDRNAVPDSRRR